MKSTPGRAFRGEQDSAGRQRDFAGRGTSVSPKNKEQQPTQNNAFSKSALYDEMKSTPGSAFRGEQDFAGRQRS